MKRVLLLLFTIAWYAVTILFIIQFVKGIFDGKASVGYFGLNFGFSVALAIWQIVVVGIFGNVYCCDTYLCFGRGGISILGIIIMVIIAPLTLIWHLIITLKPLWIMIRYSPDDY